MRATACTVLVRVRGATDYEHRGVFMKSSSLLVEWVVCAAP